MSDRKNLELHPKPKQPIQINRPLILTLSITIVTVVLLAVIGAFNTSKQHKAATTSLKATTDRPLDISPEFKNLPEDYRDVNGIKRYLADPHNHELDALMEQLNELKGSYLLLQQQLSAKDKKAETKPINPRDEAAKSSALVFAGLGGGVENMLGPQGDKARPGDKQSPELAPTEKQEELFKKQAEDKQKLAVMKASDNPEDIYDLHNMIKPVSPYQINAGTIIPATLTTGINTTVPGAGMVVAHVRKNIYDSVRGKYLLIPQGSKITGEYKPIMGPGQSRVAIIADRITRPDGTAILLGKFNGADLQGQSGLEGDLDEHTAKFLGAALMSTILAVGSSMAAGVGSNNTSLTTRQSAFTGAAGQISQIGQQLTGKVLSMQPTITVPFGTQFNVEVKRDIIIPPYKGLF